MKKMRKVMALFVVVAMLFNMCPPSVAASEGIRQTQVSVGNADIQSSDDNTGDKSAPNQENTDTKTDSDKIDKDSDSGKNDEDASSTVSEEKEEVATSESVTESVAETSEVTTEALISTEETVDEQTKTSISKETDADDEEKNSSNIKEDKDKAVDEKSEGEDSDEDAKMPAFSETKAIDGVKITVDAGEDVFPKGVTLGIRKVSKVDGKNVDEAIDKIREDGVNVVAAYTFDVKIVDKNGDEVQPADGKEVTISFVADEVNNDNLEANIYHIRKTDDELRAEALESVEEEDTVAGKTDGFSLYTVEFTYSQMQYVMNGDSTVALDDIMSELGLVGDVSEVSVSDETLFSAKKESGQWIITAHKAFSTEEWMKVTIDGVEYEITVTDDADSVASVTAGGTTTDYAIFTEAVTAWNSADAGATLKLLADVTTSSTVNVSGTKTLDFNGYGIKMTGRGSVVSVTSGANLSLKDSNTDNVTHKFTVDNPTAKGAGLATVNDDLESGYQTFTGGYITGGSASQGGGVYVDGGTFNMSGGNIIGNCTTNQGYYEGGGVALSNNANSHFVMTGGAVLYNTSIGRGGGLGIPNNATAELSGDAKIMYNKSSNNDWGGGISSFGTLSISGNVKVMYNKGASAVHPNDGSFNVSGSPVIYNNEVTVGNILSEVKINVVGTLAEGAKLGVYKNDAGVFTCSTNTSYNDDTKFISDNDSYSVGKNTDGQLYLGTTVTAIFDTDGGSAVESQTVASGSVVTKPDAPTKEGYTFVGWYKEDTFTTEWNFDSDTVTANTTIYAKWKQAISYTVTFKVLNGSWDDGNADDQTVTLTGYEGDTLKLTSDQIPEVGSKPDDTYKKTGSWDTTPSIDTTISEDTTYTYTYEQKASITPSVSMDGWTYGGAAKSPSVTGNTGNGEVTYTYAKKDTSDFTATVPSTAGDYTVKAVIAETDDHLGGKVTADFTISKAEVTAPIIADKKYTGEAQVADVTASDLYTVTTNNGGTDAGSYDVVLTLNDADNYKWAGGDGATKTLTFKIVSADTNTVTVSIDGWTYGDSAKTPTSTATFGADTVVYTYSDAEDGDYSDTVPTKAGTWYVKASVPATDNYPAGEKTASFVIAKAEVTAPTITDKHYTGKNQIADVEESDLYTITTNNGGVNVGSYDVVLTLKDAANYKWSDSEEATKTLIFKIVPVDANIVTVSIDGWTYGEEAKAPTSSAEFGEDTVVYTYSDAEDGEYSDTVPTDAGNWYVKASVPETNDYSGSEAKASFKISKAALKVTAKDATITYGDKPKDNGVEYSGFVNEDTDKSLKGTLAYTIDYKQYGDVGKSYTIVPKGVTSKNYDITFAAGKLTVKPKSLTFTWEDASVKHVYNGKKQSVKAKAETVNDDVLTFTYSDNEKKNAGKYTAKITGIEGEKAANYTISDDESTAFCEWEIEKKKMSVTAKDVTVEYDEKEHGIEVKVTDPKSGYTITYGKKKGEYDSRKSPAITKEGSLTVYFKVEADNYITYTGSAKVTVKEKKEGTSSSSVEVKEGTPSVSVNGLDEEAKALQEGESADVNVTMSVEQVAEGSEDGDGITAIRNIAEGRMLTFFDIKVIKDVDSVKTIMDTTTNILEICIPYYHISEEGLAAYRYHGSSATRLTESDSRQDGTYRVDKITKKVYIYTNQFSIYAIGYTVKSSVNEEGDTVYDISGNIRYENIDGMANLILYRNGEECKRGIAAFTGGVGTYQFEELKEGNYSLRITMDAGKDSFTLEIPIGDVSKQVVE